MNKTSTITTRYYNQLLHYKQIDAENNRIHHPSSSMICWGCNMDLFLGDEIFIRGYKTKSIKRYHLKCAKMRNMIK